MTMMAAATATTSINAGSHHRSCWPLPALAHRGGAGPSRACFHGVPLIVPVEVDTELKEAAQSAAAADALATGADDVWGAPLLDYLTTHRCAACGACCGVCGDPACSLSGDALLRRINLNVRQVNA